MDTQSAKDTVDIDLGGLSSSGEAAGDLGDDMVTMLDGLELNRACFSEKVANLNNFVMHLEALGVELEGFVLDREDNDVDVGCVGKFLEFDLLCGVLGSEVVELDRFLDALNAEIADAGDRAASCKPWQDNLLDSEQCLKQAEEQFSEIKKISASFERTLSSYKWGGNDNIEDVEITLEDDESLNVSSVITMHTTEQQRLVLRMLEKSLANEMDLEKNFFDSRKIEENLKQRMASLEQKLSLVEEEATDVWEKWLEADNTREILIGISKELLGRLQISQFNLNGLSQRESVLRAKLETPLEQLTERDVPSDKIEQLNGKLVLANSEVATLRDKVCLLEKQLKESESQLINVKASADAYQKQYTVLCSEVRETEGIILELKENISNAESQANTAEANCKLLSETNSELNRQIALLKDSGGKSDLLLQHAVASAEASLEKQNMLNSTIKDMEQVIKDLKSKVSKAESRADNAEEKFIILSESNTDLNEELRFLRSRLHCLEGSLHQVEETKVASAKDIGKQTKVFKSLVMQLAVERERLNKQLSSLASENKILVVKLKQTNKYPQEVSVALTTDQQEDRTWKNSSTNDDNEEKIADSMLDADSGLLPAIQQLLPGVDQRFCVRHIYANIRKKFPGINLRQLLWKAASTTHPQAWESVMRQMKDVNEEAFKHLIAIPPRFWSRSRFSGRPACDTLVNNIFEAFNNVILDVRGKPIITMLEEIRSYLMKRWASNREKISKFHGGICPKIQKRLQKELKKTRYWIPNWSGLQVFEISHTCNIAEKKIL